MDLSSVIRHLCSQCLLRTKLRGKSQRKSAFVDISSRIGNHLLLYYRLLLVLEVWDGKPTYRK